MVEFLVLDRLFPRSAFHALGEAQRCLAELDPDVGRVGVAGVISSARHRRLATSASLAQLGWSGDCDSRRRR